MNAFVYRVHGKAADGTVYVSDGAIMLRSDLLPVVPSTDGVKEITADQVASMVYTRPAAITRLADLVPSRVAPAVYRTPDDVALAEKYVQMLGALGVPISLGTTGPRGIVVLSDGTRVLGCLMPVAMPPEIGTYLPPPEPGASRGRVEALVAGLGRIGLEDGTEASFEPAALVGLAVEMLVHALVDAEVSRDVTGRLRARWVWPAGTKRPPQTLPIEAAKATPSLRWPSRVAFDGMQLNGLLGAFDGGTWMRAIAKVRGAAVPAADVDEIDVMAALVDAYLAPDSQVTAGRNAARDGIWFVLDRSRGDAAAARASIAELAAAFGVEGVDVADPLDVRAVHRALGEAFARAGKKERVWLVGDKTPFVLIREAIRPQGPFMRVLEHREAPQKQVAVPPASAAFEAFVSAIRTHSKEIRQVASLRLDATSDAPAFTVRVLQRVFGEHPEDSYFVVTDGLSARPLRSTGPGSLVRFELSTWSSRHDAELARTIGRLGLAMHVMAAPGSPPFHAGHSISSDGPVWMGWSRVLLARLVSGAKTPDGDVDILRVLPISDAENEALRARQSAFGGWGFVTELENRDFPGTLGRWYAPAQ